MKNETHRLGDYIREVNVRNRELKVTQLLGLSMTKQFRPSTSNIVGVDLSNYKIVNHNTFAFDPMSVIRVHKVPIAINNTTTPIIVSPAYYTFEVSDTSILLPQYLMMWIMRPEFDRYADYKSDSAVRGGYDWKELCDTPICVPSIERQREIVSEYETLTRRIRLNEQMIEKLEATAQALYRKTFVAGIDKQNLPAGWRIGTLGEVAQYVDEKISLTDIDEAEYIATENMLKDKRGIAVSTNKPNEGRGTRFQIDDILVSNIRPYFKKIWRASFCGASSNDVLCFRAKDIFNPPMLYYTLEQDTFFDYVMAGSNGVKMPRGDKEWIMKYPLAIPPMQDIKQYQGLTDKLRKQIVCRKQEKMKLTELQSLLLARMGK